MKKTFTVTIDIPDGVSVARMKEYIKEAVRCWHGSKDPEDPIFYIDRKSVKVKESNQI